MSYNLEKRDILDKEIDSMMPLKKKIWNWQKDEWPNFIYQSKDLEDLEQTFLHNSGVLFGIFKHLNDQDQLKVEIISQEALETSEIEGEYLDRESLQSSIARHFGLKITQKKVSSPERGISDLLIDLYKSYDKELRHETLCRWHYKLMGHRNDLRNIGCYRTGKEAMQVISGPIHAPYVHFEAPPFKRVKKEMDSFINWFNITAPKGKSSLSTLARCGIAHLYFECIHPFEDGNGRIGRALSEKVLAQSLGKPTLIALATILNQDKKAYYKALEQASQKNEITDWLCYFAKKILQALCYTQSLMEFLIAKAKLFEHLQSCLNPRQEKCLLKMFQAGPNGFTGGLSAENYIRITKATRATATRDLNDLVVKGALNKTGERKSTRYTLNIKATGPTKSTS